jgi:hypothetical protein
VIQWRTWPDGSQDSPIDISHQGPCAVYMKRMGEGGSGSVAGGGWFKIWVDGFHSGEFCTERLRKNGNKMEVIIPSDLAGYVLIRDNCLTLFDKALIVLGAITFSEASLLPSIKGQVLGGRSGTLGNLFLFIHHRSKERD